MIVLFSKLPPYWIMKASPRELCETNQGLNDGSYKIINFLYNLLRSKGFGLVMMYVYALSHSWMFCILPCYNMILLNERCRKIFVGVLRDLRTALKNFIGMPEAQETD